MALSPCNTTTDPSGRELVQHGTAAFPIGCYHDDLRSHPVPWHWHQELEAAIVTEGRCLLKAGSQSHTLYPGEGFFVNTQVLHGCWEIDASTCRLHSLVFHPRLVGGSQDSILFATYLEPLMGHPSLEMVYLTPAIPWQRDALAAIEAAWTACTQEPEGYEFDVRHRLSTLIRLLYGHMPVSPLSQPQPQSGARIKAMLTYIHENFGSELTIRTIAGAAMVSESECLRCFRKTIGTTPIQYVKQYRIDQAAQLLCSTKEKISEIASACGFQDMSYFTKTFRECKGCTPTQFREKFSAQNGIAEAIESSSPG